MALSFDRLLLAGDTHAHKSWLTGRVLPAAAEVDAVLVVGNFGYWPEAKDFLAKAADSRRRYGVDTLFLRGNHEHHPALERAQRQAGGTAFEPVCLEGSLWYLPNASRIEVAGLEVAILGGGTSVDRRARHPGVDWFPEEEITPAELEVTAARGYAPVMLTHDAPAGYAIPGLPAPDPLWWPMLAQASDHRRRLRRAVDTVTPELVVHGHFHHGYEVELDVEWGSCRVAGLGSNNQSHWGRILTAADGHPELSDWVAPLDAKRPRQPPVGGWSAAAVA